MHRKRCAKITWPKKVPKTLCWRPYGTPSPPERLTEWLWDRHLKVPSSSLGSGVAKEVSHTATTLNVLQTTRQNLGHEQSFDRSVTNVAARLYRMVPAHRWALMADEQHRAGTCSFLKISVQDQTAFSDLPWPNHRTTSSSHLGSSRMSSLFKPNG